MSGDDTNFVLIYRGSISSGISDWESERGTETNWGFDGHVYLVDTEKTRLAGMNVNKRKIALEFTSDAPNTLFLDGKAYELSPSVGAQDLLGRVLILRDEGEPVRTNRTLPLRDQKDLVTIGDFAERDFPPNDAATKPVAGAPTTQP